MSEKKKFKRAIILVDPKFQLIFVACLLAVNLITLIVLFVANASLIKRFIESGEPLEELRTAMNGIFIVAGFINFAVITLGGLLLSHRISGPLYRLKQHMLAIARGDKVQRLKFRDGDFFQDLAETFNKQRDSKK